MWRDDHDDEYARAIQAAARALTEAQTRRPPMADHPPRFRHAHRLPGPLTPETRDLAIHAALDRDLDDADMRGIRGLLWAMLLVVPATMLVLLTLVVLASAVALGWR